MTNKIQTPCTFEPNMDYFLVFDGDGKQIAKFYDASHARQFTSAMNAYRPLVEAAKLVGPAIQSMMDEAAEKKATDWGIVNDCLVKIGRAIKLADHLPDATKKVT